MTVQRIRKNAHKRIAQLINQATYFEMESHSMGYDDCMNSNGYTKVDQEYVEQFMNDCYHDLVVEVKYDDNMKPVWLEMADGQYYFCKRVIARFTPEPIEVESQTDFVHKPRMTYDAVKAYLNDGFVSPLNHEGRKEPEQTDPDKQIVKIKILWSESGWFNRAFRSDGDDDINREVSLNDYNRVAAYQVSEMRRQNWEGGYYKTKVEITTASGETCTFRHDVCPNEPTLAGEWAEWVDYCRSEQGQRKQQEVIDAIERAAQRQKEEQAKAEQAKLSNDNVIMFPSGKTLH